jgi:hypothetical protein
MKLIEYMRLKKLDPAGMSAMVDGIGEHGIRKLMYGERNPSVEVAAQIEAATLGEVGLKDWLDTPPRPKRSAQPPQQVA